MAIGITFGQEIKFTKCFALVLAATLEDGSLPASAQPGNRELSIFRQAIRPKAPFCHFCEAKFPTMDACSKHFDEAYLDAWKCDANGYNVDCISPY